jgi:hypothetical protein
MAVAMGGSAVGPTRNHIQAHVLRFAHRRKSGHDFDGRVGEDSPNLSNADGLIYISRGTVYIT